MTAIYERTLQRTAWTLIRDTYVPVAEFESSFGNSAVSLSLSGGGLLSGKSVSLSLSGGDDGGADAV